MLKYLMNNYKLETQFESIVNAVERKLLGKRHAISMTLAAFFARGHVLLEDIPGVGKTTLAKQLSHVLGLQLGRIQFTSDLLPSDILGVNYFDQSQSRFVFKKGPIFTPFLLADEINRSMPKTQSALLEAMEEYQVTIDGKAYTLDEPFFVMGTQNPYEEVGTFTLPHSQLDRFICSFGIGYPDKTSERAILANKTSVEEEKTKALLDLESIQAMQERVTKVHLSDALLDYLQEIIGFTRESGLFYHGLSTRGALALRDMTCAWAFLHGRDYAIPDDTQAVIVGVCTHRLKFKEGKTTPERIRDELFTNIQPDT
ncbi:MAG: AAA family ATPase [Campylobacterota bacterium]|nr:AAA family ATPase [Campylobacterota bacterium]